MSMFSKTQAGEAFVLKKRTYKETDELVTLLTKEYGKLRVFAKGAKKITSKRLSHIQTGNVIFCIMSRANDLFFLQETYLKSGLSLVKQDAKRTNFLYQFFFILDRLLPEMEEQEDVYYLVCNFCKDLSRSEQFTLQQMNQYIQDLLMLLGYGVDDAYHMDAIGYTEKVIQEKVPLHVII